MNPEDPIEALLRNHDGGDLPDAGFSRRVLAALPCRRAPIHSSFAWRRVTLDVLGAAAGAALAVARWGRPDFRSLEAGLESAAAQAAAALADPWSMFALLAVAAAALYAWRGGRMKLI